MFLPSLPTESHLAWSLLFMELLGGLTIFFYGIEISGRGMQKAAGQQLRYLISTLTHNRLIGLLTGAIVTVVIQSSTATTVLLVSFVQGRLMSFSQTLPVILGADIGTTVTAQLVAFKVTQYALWGVAAGYGMQLFSKNIFVKNWGEILFGIGLIFFGMKLMSDAMLPLQELSWIYNLLQSFKNPLLGIMVGALVTALIHSSAAFVGIVIMLAQQHFIDLESGIALMLGANIGTCITAVLASIGTEREAKRVAFAHVMFKFGGVLLFLLWIPLFAESVAWLGGHLHSSMARDIANAHTIFNLAIGIIFFPFIALFESLINRLMPDVATPKSVKKLQHLDHGVNLQGTPALAIDLARKEISHMAQETGRLLETLMLLFGDKRESADPHHPHLNLIDGIKFKESQIDFLEQEITQYLLKTGQEGMSDKDAHEIFSLISITKDMESIGDIVDKNIIPLSYKKKFIRENFSKEGQQELQNYHLKICKQITRLTLALSEMNPEKAQKLMIKTDNYLKLEDQYRLEHLKRVKSENKSSIETHEVHMELLDLMKQINVYVGNMAKTLSAISA